MSRRELEELLANRLPQCVIVCAIHADNSLSVEVTSPDGQQFTIANIDRSRYRGEVGTAQLIREILQEMVISRQSSNLT